MNNYVIAMGGTGARCLEAIVYLSAAGLFDDPQIPLQVLIIDPDKNNGNSKKTTELIGLYRELQNADQPSAPQRSEAAVRPPGLFRTRINPGSEPVFWHNPSPNQKFRDAIHYDGLRKEGKDFLSLFYSDQDLEMELDVGYRGRTGVGAVTMKQDLGASFDQPLAGLKQLVENLRADAQGNTSPKVFAAGSVFGGTGATGLPTVPELIKKLVNPQQQTGGAGVGLGDNIRFGCAMMAPYFSFPSPSSQATESGPAPESALHPVATKAVLMHYAHEHPPYEHIYLIGAPNRKSTNRHVSGGSDQKNSPHYAELVAGLAAWDFFALKNLNAKQKALHFANSLTTTKDQAKPDVEEKASDLGVGWSTLPISVDTPGDVQTLLSLRRNTLRCRLVAFTTFMYFYKYFLFPAIQANLHLGAIFYRDNFRSLSLRSGQNPELTKRLNDFSTSYLDWLGKVGGSLTVAPGNIEDGLFAFPAFVAEAKNALDFLGRLAPRPNPPSGVEAYSRLLDELNALTVKQRGNASATGLLIYLLFEAVWNFCKKNYNWKVDGAA
jgi:hypothetical protein